MKNFGRFLLVAWSVVPAFVASLAAQPARETVPGTGTYRISHIFHVGAEGSYWDYVTVDEVRHQVYFSRGSHMMILDGATGATVADIRGQERNHGVALVPSVGRGFISDGDDASVVIFDLKSHQVLGKIKVNVDADEIAYDAVNNKVLVVSGDPNTVISISPSVDPRSGTADVTLGLGGKPESFAVDGGKAYINLTDRDQVVVVDTQSMKVIDRWPCAPGGTPVAMAMDHARRRLFVGCRNPQKVVVMSADDGRILGDFPIGAGVDSVQFDGDIFASCRDGSLAVGRETRPGHFETVQSLSTKPWAGTMGLDATTHTLYLPTAEFAQPPGVKTRTAVIPDSFMVLVVNRSAN